MYKHLLTTLTLILILVPVVAKAETVVRIGEGVVVDEGQIVNGDYYVSVGPFGNTTMSGTIDGDMNAFGGSVTANGTVNEDVLVVGGVTQLHASVTDDVRILSGETIVAESIGGDLFVLSGTLKVLSTASIDGNVYFFGGSGVIDGRVGGSIFGTMERLRVDGPVGGDVDVNAYDGVTLGSKASVEGSVSYISFRELVRAPEAVVEGDVNAKPEEVADSKDKWRDALVPLFMVLFATLSFYLLFKDKMVNLVTTIRGRYLKNTLIGFAMFLAAPVISLLMMVTVLGVFVGVVGLSLTVLLFTLSYVFSGLVAGSVLSQLLKNKSEASLLWITVGTIFVYLVGYVPIIGPILVASFTLMTLGGLTLMLYHHLEG